MFEHEIAAMMDRITYIGTLVTLECGVCGCAHAIPRLMYDKAINDGTNWHCPNGHCLVFLKHRSQELEQELRRSEEQSDMLRRANESLHNQLTSKEYSIRSLKAAKTKIMNRVKNGVCPCCNRSFADLQRHFKTKHPEVFDKK